MKNIALRIAVGAGEVLASIGLGSSGRCRIDHGGAKMSSLLSRFLQWAGIDQCRYRVELFGECLKRNFKQGEA